MEKKSIKTLKIVLVMLIIAITVTIPVTSNASFSFWSFINKKNTSEAISKKYTSMNQYSSFLDEFNGFTDGLNSSTSVDDLKLNIIKKTEELQKKYGESSSISSASNQILNKAMNSTTTDSSEFLQSIMSTSKGSLKSNNNAMKSLEPNVVATNEATTAGKLSGDKYKVKLSGNIYYADLDSNGNPTSNKWVVLVHGFMMNGQAMADAVGQMYLEQGFNILAPDLRGFGKSEGSVAMGYLESLDVWDWLTYLNQQYPNNCDEIVVHGVSLGGATTVFLSGLQVNGQTIKDKHVPTTTLLLNNFFFRIQSLQVQYLFSVLFQHAFYHYPLMILLPHSSFEFYNYFPLYRSFLQISLCLFIVIIITLPFHLA